MCYDGVNCVDEDDIAVLEWMFVHEKIRLLILEEVCAHLHPIQMNAYSIWKYWIIICENIIF